MSLAPYVSFLDPTVPPFGALPPEAFRLNIRIKLPTVKAIDSKSPILFAFTSDISVH